MIRYLSSADSIEAPQLQGFFVGWPSPPSSETHLELLQKSDRVVVAADEVSGAVIGFITAITDGVLAAYIPFLEVLPNYQGQGIGRELVRRLLSDLDELYMVDLMCDPELQSFYQSLGMSPASGMVRRSYERQAG